VSPDSVASAFVNDEIFFARANNKLIVPVLLRSTPDSLLLGRIQSIEGRDGRDCLPELLAALRPGPVPLDESPATASLLDEKTRKRIQEYTSEFVGREGDIAEVKRWVEANPCGFRLIRGNPGVGKSALMSTLSCIGSDSLDITFASPSIVGLLRGEAWPNW